MMTTSGDDGLAWHVLSATVRGASHEKQGQPNQDAVATAPLRGPARTVVLSVADGHGAERYTRSGTGSLLATRILLELGADFVDVARTESLSTLRSLAEDVFPRKLARRWRKHVWADINRFPLSDHGPCSREPGTQECIDAYGTTALGVVITEQLLVCWQLGDGDILHVSEKGEVTAPLAPEVAQLGIETDSLAHPDAWERVRTHWAPLTGSGPSLVMVSTDGLTNSFESIEGFRAFGSGTLQRLRTEGIERTRARLPAWLSQATSFSGDDITVALAWRPASPEKLVPE